MRPITSFKKNHFFLSNFYLCNIEIDNIIWPSAEHIYQACKTKDLKIREKIRLLKTAAETKKMGKTIILRSDWNKVKLNSMCIILNLKFTQNLKLGILLINTGDSELIEGNYWHDNYWGSCNCPKCRSITGQNILGQLLMKIRHNIQ